MPPIHIQTTDLESTFRALRSRDPSKISKSSIPQNSDYKSIPRQNYAPSTSVSTNWGNGMAKFASTSGGTIYGQPQFFSPVHTPINWQIPSKRLEIYQWMFLPKTDVLAEDFTYEILESKNFDIEQVIEDSITGGFLFETLNYPKIMNSEGGFNQPPRLSMRECEKKECFSFVTSGNWRELRITEEHHLFVLDGEIFRKNRKTLNDIIKIEDKLIKRVQARDVKKSDFLLTPIPSVGTKKIDPDLAWAIGYCIANGTLYKTKSNYNVVFTGNKDEVSLKKCETILNTHFNEQVDSSTENGWRIRLTTKDAYKFFSQYIVNDGLNKKFTTLLFQFDKETRLNLLAGYLDGDGSFTHETKLVADCYVKDLSDQLYWMFLSCGINCSINITGEYDSTSSKSAYRLMIPSSDVNKIARHMRGSKVPQDFIPKKKRNLCFFYEEDGVQYFVQPIHKINKFIYTGYGYDIEMTNDRKALVADGYICSNSRFFYENEPKVASAIDFYSYFPMSDWEHECGDPKIRLYFDKFKKRLNLPKWARLMSHEIHLLGDCFPFAEISCELCGGSGVVGDEVCDHEGGTIKRLIILNPDFVDVHTAPLNPEPIIALRPDEELINMVQRKTPGYDRLSPEVIALVSSGQPIRLDNRNVSHLKYGECGYSRYGVGMVRRLFPVLSYKTKLMVAQWIVAERLIVPIKIVKVGSDERPAGPADIASVQAQLAETANDPNMTIVTHHNFDLEWYGAAGKVLTLSNELEFINQEVLDGMMINNALLNGEGPNFSSAAVGIEAMIQRLTTFRNQISEWIIEFLYLPEAIRQGFVDKNPETDELEYVVPKIKWDSMHLRDQQQYRTFILQLYEKGLVSAQTVLEAFDIDPDQEIERKRYDSVQMMALGQGFGQQQQGGMEGMGGGLGGLGGGMPPMGDLGGGGEPPIGPPSGGLGGPAAPTGGGEIMPKNSAITAQAVDPTQFGGRVLKKKTRDKIMSEQEKIYNKQQSQQNSPQGYHKGQDGQIRDEKGRIAFTKIERKLMDHLLQYGKDGIIKYPIVPQFRIQAAGTEYPVDFAFPHLKIALEADGEIFHSSAKQMRHDNERDTQLAQIGWTVLRFKDSEIEKQPQQVMSTIVKTIMEKEMSVKNNASQDK